MEHSLRPGYAMPDNTPSRRVCFYDSQTVSDLLVESMADGGNNPVPTVPSELAEHSTTVELETSEVVGVSEPTEQSRSGDNLSVHAGPLILKPAPAETTEQWRLKERSLPEVASELRQSDGPARINRPEYTGSRPESVEAIVVVAIGSAAPWFLTGWAQNVEIECMTDTGCQVTILFTTVFQRMCTVNPAVHSALRPFRRRLVSPDCSPLMVQGQLELDIVFPGLCCKMLFVVANIGSDGLLGTEALKSYLPHQLELQRGQ